MCFPVPPVDRISEPAAAHNPRRGFGHASDIAPKPATQNPDRPEVGPYHALRCIAPRVRGCATPYGSRPSTAVENVECGATLRSAMIREGAAESSVRKAV